MLCFWQVLLGYPPEAQRHISLSSAENSERKIWETLFKANDTGKEPQTSETREEKREKTIQQQVEN